MPQTILGIDIGSYSVKVAEVRRSFKNFAFTNFFERRIQYNEVLTPEESRAAALQGVLEDNALTWDGAFLSLPGHIVSARVVALPFGNRKKIEQTLPFEVENFVPFPMDELVIDYHVIESAKDFSRILVFYAQSAQIAKLLTFVNNAGVEPRRLCVGGVELLNLVAIGLVPPEDPYAIIDMGHDTTVVSICRGRQLEFTRTLSIGGRLITAAVALAVGVSDDEADRLKSEVGHVISEGGEFPPSETIPFKVVSAIQGVMEEVLVNLRQTIFAYREQTGSNLEGIYLCGGTSRMEGIDEFLSFALQQNVTRLDCFDFPFTQIDRSDAAPEVTAGALALALRGVATTGLPQVDFRKGEFLYRADTEQFEGGMKKVGFAVAAMLFLAVGYFGMRWHALSRQLEQVNKEITQLVTQALPKSEAQKIKGAAEAQRQLKGATKAFADRSDRLKALLNDSALTMLHRISKAMPTRDAVQLNVNTFHYKPGEITVSAAASSSAEVDLVQHAVARALTKHAEDGERMVDPADGGEPLVIEYPKIRAGAKEEILFDMRIRSEAVVKASTKNGSGRGGRRGRR